MAKSKQRTRTTIIRENQPEDDEVDVQRVEATKAIEDDISEQAYSEFVGRFRGTQSCRVKVYRQTPRGRQYCFSGSPEEIESEETIRLYHAEQPYAHEEGNYVLYVTVNGELRDPFPINISPQIKGPGLPASPSSGMAVDPGLRSLQDQMNRLELRLTQQDKPPMLEMVDGLAKLDQLRGGSGGAMGMDTIVKCIEIGSRMNGGGSGNGGGDAGWEGMLRDIIKDNAPALIGLFQMAARKMGTPPAPEAPPVVPPVPAPVPLAPPTTTEEIPPMTADEEKVLLLESLKFLKKKSAAHSDPGLYIDLIIDNREDPLYARLISEIVENDFSAFASLDPDITKPEHAEFFGIIHDRIRRVFKPADTVATVGTGQGGDAGDVAGNGTTGKTGGQ